MATQFANRYAARWCAAAAHPILYQEHFAAGSRDLEAKAAQFGVPPSFLFARGS